MLTEMSISQWAKLAKKQSEGVRFCFKNTLVQTAFSAILPSGYTFYSTAHHQ